jgi:AbrB family looped-hinge helix DNA binding protein
MGHLTLTGRPKMETTKLSTRGQVVIPKELRKSYHWDVGQELDVIDTGDGLLLKARTSRDSASWDDVVGCLSHLAKGKPKATDEQMQTAVQDMAAKRFLRSRAK